MTWIPTIMIACATCAMLAGGATGSAFAAEAGHVKEFIKHAQEGTSREKEAISIWTKPSKAVGMPTPRNP